MEKCPTCQRYKREKFQNGSKYQPTLYLAESEWKFLTSTCERVKKSMSDVVHIAIRRMMSDFTGSDR